jgi:hypothetical protein
VTAGATADELEKRIATELIEGGPSIFFDNLNNTAIRSNLLASAITERPARVRLLGKSLMVPLNSSALVILAGNGLTLFRGPGPTLHNYQRTKPRVLFRRFERRHVDWIEQGRHVTFYKRGDLFTASTVVDTLRPLINASLVTCDGRRSGNGKSQTRKYQPSLSLRRTIFVGLCLRGGQKGCCDDDPFSCSPQSCVSLYRKCRSRIEAHVTSTPRSPARSPLAPWRLFQR